MGTDIWGQVIYSDYNGDLRDDFTNDGNGNLTGMPDFSSWGQIINLDKWKP